MRCFYLLLVTFASLIPCVAQDEDRIRDEAEDERIADEAEDFQLIAEFDELEQKVAVEWNPSLGTRSGTLEDGLLIPFRCGPDGSLIADWPVIQPCPRTMAYTVMIPVTEERVKEVEVVACKPETRTRTIEVSKTRTEVRTREVPVEAVSDSGEVITKTTTETYNVEVPYTEQVEQQYTVMVPYTETKTVTYAVAKCVFETKERTVLHDCICPKAARIKPNSFPIFRGDRRPGDWDEFQADVAAKCQLYVALFESEDDWTTAWDTVFDPDAYVIILDKVSNLPEFVQADEAQDQLNPPACDSTILPLPLLARRSGEADHQFPFSPYVKALSRRPSQLAMRPVLVSKWLAGNVVADNGDIGEWTYEIEMAEPHWTVVDGQQVTLLEVERTLSAGHHFIVSPPAPPRFAWMDVFAMRVPVYTSACGEMAPENIEEVDLGDQIDLIFAAKQALDQGNGDAVIEHVAKLNSAEMLDANFLCQAAFLLHRQNDEGMAHAFVSLALDLNPSPLERPKLVRSQGNSRLWLEQTVQDIPLQRAVRPKLNASRKERMSEIYRLVMDSKELSPEQVDSLMSKRAEPASQEADVADTPPAPVPDPQPEQ